MRAIELIVEGRRMIDDLDIGENDDELWDDIYE